MHSDRAQSAPVTGVWGTIIALVNADGSAAHPMGATLTRPLVPARDVADVVHVLCTLHGRQPGIIDFALANNSLAGALPWLEAAAGGFAAERALLAKLASAAGPLPSTPGHAESENAVAAQRHAINMLAQSDRNGCGVGAAIALVLDWAAIRTILNAAAERFGFTPSASTLPDTAATAAMVEALPSSASVDRAMGFAVQQLLAQHRGLWDLLDARASARASL
ncbi:MAG: hypothetical protein WC803_06330 [Sphingomonas sp.]|jgi:hypothetical protein